MRPTQIDPETEPPSQGPRLGKSTTQQGRHDARHAVNAGQDTNIYRPAVFWGGNTTGDDHRAGEEASSTGARHGAADDEGRGARCGRADDRPYLEDEQAGEEDGARVEQSVQLAVERLKRDQRQVVRASVPSDLGLAAEVGRDAWYGCD